MKILNLLLFNYLLLFNINWKLNAQDLPVTVEIIKEKSSQELWAKNNCPGKVTVSLLYTVLNNCYSEPNEPTIILLPNDYVLIATIYSSNPDNAWNYNYNYFWRMGTPDAHPDGTVYQLPYKSQTSHKIIQGYNGTLTHFGDQAYATDFGMPVGTPVLAAREGKVVEVVQNNDGAGTTDYYRNKANYIRIEHSDGTIAEYTHIKQYGANVSEGDDVETGALIGYSGNVGYSTGPHLHFHVCRPLNGKDIETFPVKFKTSDSNSEELIEGNTYTAP
jgi:murein DD-endopeptidase MepM/ murein hydrolase activator NlpD